MYGRLAELFLVVAFLSAQAGQAPTGISQHYKPGDAVRYTVSFEGDPNFTSVDVVFRKQGSIDPDQLGLNVGFQTDHFTKVKPGVFDVSGHIPEQIATGIYQLAEVATAIAPTGRKSYDASSFNLKIEIRNDQKYDFPPLKSVTPN